MGSHCTCYMKCILAEFDIPVKVVVKSILVNICLMHALLGHGEKLYHLFFNFALECAIRKVQEKRGLN
jgi:hypothetical protein